MTPWPHFSRLTLTTLILLCVKLALALYIYSLGFLSLSADEYSRGMTAARWALDGDLPLGIYMNAWLPFETYVNGLALMVWGDVIWTPRITVFIFSCVLLVYFVKLVHYVFKSHFATLAAGLLLVFNPWFVWLSGTPMLDIYYLTPFVAGLYYVAKWIEERRGAFLLAGGLLFFLSTGFHSQAWILVNAANLFLSVYAVIFLRVKDRRAFLELAGFFLLSNLFIILYIPIEHAATGEWLYMFRDHAARTLPYYSDYDVPLWKKLAYYPRLVYRSTHWLVWLFFPVGIFAALRARRRTAALFPLAAGIIALAVYSAYNVFSVPASAAPGRYSLPFFMLFAPYSALGIYTIFFLNLRAPVSWLLRGAAAALVVYLLWTSFLGLPDYETKGAREAVNVGLFVGDTMDSKWPGGDGTIMLERAYWDFLYIRLAVGHFPLVRFDRPITDEYAGTPSDLLSMSDAEILARVKKEKTRFIIVRDPALKERLSRLGFVEIARSSDEWVAFEVDPGAAR
ncbi:MAG: hypothetical protein KJ002_02720 [Candidatus Dadabacteria bacterium]|nr:hypothetical protein [Candidatus Dadabacteria bacterium]